MNTIAIAAAISFPFHYIHHTTGPPLLNPTNLAPKIARRMLHYIHHNILRQKSGELVRNHLKPELRE